jgi:tRNA threonylcarbamoyladenosine biosynthesis protein TsaB
MILAIDTATRWTGLALHNGDTLLAESGWHSRQNQTIELAPAVQMMLDRQQVTAADLTAVAVALGPGSYTGLRVGVGLAKGLALANQTALVGVPTLDIVAAALTQHLKPIVRQILPSLIVVAEAGRSRICAGSYQWERGRNGGWKPESEPVITSWPDLLAEVDPSTLFAGEISPEAAKLIRQAAKRFKIFAPSVNPRRAAHLAEIGWQRVRRRQVDDAAELAPLYLRDPAGLPIGLSTGSPV